MKRLLKGLTLDMNLNIVKTTLKRNITFQNLLTAESDVGLGKINPRNPSLTRNLFSMIHPSDLYKRLNFINQ